MVSAIYQYVNQSNSQQLNRSYNFCNKKCSSPIYCAINMKPIVYSVKGIYTKSSNNQFNTILTFKNDCFLSLYIPLKAMVTIALQSNPNNILSKIRSTQSARKNILVPAGTEKLIIKLYFNISYC